MAELIEHQLIFNSNSLGHQPSTAQHCHAFALQTIVLAAAAVHSTMSEYSN
jgi:hypothetical protein